MSKIYNLYENEVDKTWYDSSNVIYSECDDVQDGLKVLRVTFKNGRTYKYSDVNVAIFNSEGISSNFNVEGYIIRKNNFSVNCVDNLMILLKVTILKALRNFKYYLLNCCN